MTDSRSMAEALQTWAEREKLDAIVAMFPHVGPVADALPAIHRDLNVPVHLVRRPWDAQMFPAAKSGFFPFWEKTSRWLGQQFLHAQMTLL
jgi:hypothetical protein